MRRLCKYARHVIALALLLPALQALQETRLLCQICGNCGWQAEVQRQVCCKRCRRGDKTAADRVCKASVLTSGCEKTTLGVVPRSGGCPPDCWCQQQRQPQLERGRPITLSRAVDAAISSMEKARTPLCASLPGRVIHATPCTLHASAQHCCAALCRFLA